jgi:hypothetical protein
MDPGFYGGKGVYEPLRAAFDAAYGGNRAPLPVYIHTTWVEKDPGRLDELKRFAGGRTGRQGLLCACDRGPDWMCVWLWRRGWQESGDWDRRARPRQQSLQGSSACLAAVLAAGPFLPHSRPCQPLRASRHLPSACGPATLFSSLLFIVCSLVSRRLHPGEGRRVLGDHGAADSLDEGPGARL